MLSAFGLGMKSARVGDQIDAEVTAAKALVQNCMLTAQQFDFVESQLQQFAQLISQADPSAAMQFQNMQQQINNIQAQIVSVLQQVHQSLTKIDGLTDKIQN
jgi:conjugal transfer/entry exclusion protein